MLIFQLIIKIIFHVLLILIGLTAYRVGNRMAEHMFDEYRGEKHNKF